MRCSRIAAFLYYINAQYNGRYAPYTSSDASVVLDKVEDVNARFARLRRQLLLREKPWFVHTAPSAYCLGRDPSTRLSWLARDDKIRRFVCTPCRGEQCSPDLFAHTPALFAPPSCHPEVGNKAHREDLRKRNTAFSALCSHPTLAFSCGRSLGSYTPRPRLLASVEIPRLAFIRSLGMTKCGA